MNVQSIPLVAVRRTTGRPLRAATVTALAASLDTIGLLNPITVALTVGKDGPSEVESYWIVAGQHRVEAARTLGWSNIDAVIVEMDAPHAELCEIDENLIRAELTASQRAAHHKRRKEIMTALGLVSAPGQGGDRGNQHEASAGFALASYAAQAAADLGVSRRTVETDIARAEQVAPEVMAAIAGTDLDTGANLDALAKTPTAEQSDKLAQMRARAAAPKPRARPRAEPITSIADRQAEPILKAWNTAPPAGRQRFLELIGAAVTQQGAA